jgi:hypothetical protein
VSEFWWGVLALPVIALAVGAAAAALLGGWLLAEKWYERRFQKLDAVRLPEEIGAKFSIWTLGNSGARGAIAANILTRPHAFMFQPIMGGCALILVAGKPDVKLVHLVNRSIDKALLDVCKEDANV